MTDVRQYIRQIVNAYNNKDGDRMCDLIMLEENHPGRAQLQESLYVLQEGSIPGLVQDAMKNEPRPLREFTTRYLEFSIDSALSTNTYAKVYETISACYGAFLGLFTAPDAQWLTNLLMNLSYSLLDWAIMADQEQPNAKEPKVNDAAGQQLTRAFNIAISDKVPNALEDSKKMALYYLANLSFRAYFRLHSTRLMPTLLANISKAGVDLKDYPMSQQVIHRYYLGRYYLYQLDLRRAEANLGFAFRNCPDPGPDPGANEVIYKDSRLILTFLTACRLCLGRLPSPHLLQSYDLERYFAPLMQAVRVGDLGLLTQALSSPDLMGWLVKKELYFLLKEKLIVLCWRSLIRRICVLSNGPSDIQQRVNLFDLLKVASAMTKDNSYDIWDVECITASLMDQGYIKGYIHSQKKILVLGKTNPFPKIYSVEVLEDIA
ncbi:hypothetical protein BGZ83_009936 [Gryganskiella cystojenkinii]|nr:hypothetical protein BGZ83_009936 [Gryganskiella cystojenkinii]